MMINRGFGSEERKYVAAGLNSTRDTSLKLIDSIGKLLIISVVTKSHQVCHTMCTFARNENTSVHHKPLFQYQESRICRHREMLSSSCRGREISILYSP